jgi:hypothetical protein
LDNRDLGKNTDGLALRRRLGHAKM